MYERFSSPQNQVGHLKIVQDEEPSSVVQGGVPGVCCLRSMEPAALLIVVRTPKAATTDFQVARLGGTVGNRRIK